MYLEFPSGPVPLDSNLYIERNPVEQRAYEEINQPGCIIRIKAPRQMGKTSFLLRVRQRAERLGYRTAWIDFQQAEESIFRSLDRFLRWFCTLVSRQLHVQPMLEDYWDEDVGSKVSSTLYLQEYLLPQSDRPLFVAFNELNRVFDHDAIAQEFLPLLRSWHEEAKQDEMLQKLRFAIAYSTEVYVPFDINQSPFNIGLPVKLPEFTLEQIQDLAKRHGLKWKGNVQARKLMAMVGGHPYLIRLALYYLVHPPETNWSLEKLLAEAPTQTGIYSEHLRRILAIIQNNPELEAALNQVIEAEESIQLNPLLAYQLESVGLVKLNGNQSTLSCDLYRLYFKTQTLVGEDLQRQISQLQQEKQRLQRLSNLDDLTGVSNHRYFEMYLEDKWHELTDTMAPLSLILLDVDYLKIYNNTRGHEAGNDCLRQVAEAICHCTNYPNNLVARYEGGKFAVVLPCVETSIAFEIAECIRKEVKKLALAHDLSKIGGLPASVITVSLGVASSNLDGEDSPTSLIQRAERAMLYAKRCGRDRTEISSNIENG
jgi:diguanylate cyclase (GGDEF)-like protein